MDLSRTRALIGTEKLNRLKNACVAVCGLGGVGGYAAEALARSGVGRLILADDDVVEESNLNRQIFATEETVGLPKTEAAERRIHAICPQTETTALRLFLSPQTVDRVFDLKPDFIIDAVDNVTAKLALAAGAKARGIGFAASMGTGNRTDPTRFRVGQIGETAGCGCGLARVMRRECKKRGLDMTVVYSTEPPTEPVEPVPGENGRHPPASAGWVVGAAGLALAGCAIQWLTKQSDQKNNGEESILMNQFPMILDGSMGINLMRAGMPDGVCVEQWLLEHSEIFMKILSDYADAGSQIVYAPTFGGNRFKLARFGLENRVREINSELVRLSKKAVGERAKVFGDVSPSGGFVAPIGTLTFEELEEAFREQISAFREAGADGVVIETQMTVSDFRAALLAARELRMPAFVTVTVNEHGKMLDGTDFASAVVIAQQLGAEAVGMNCSDGPETMLRNLGRGYQAAKVPLIAKPNAGLPDPVTGEFPLTAEKFAAYAEPLMQAGASILGGCCGTDASHIRALTAAAQRCTPPTVHPDAPDFAATAHEIFPVADLKRPSAEIVSGEWLIDDCEEAEDCDYLCIRIDDAVGLDNFCESFAQLKKPVLLSGAPEMVAAALRRYDGVALNAYR